MPTVTEYFSKNVPVLSDLPPAVAESLAKIAQQQVYKSGQTVIFSIPETIFRTLMENFPHVEENTWRVIFERKLAEKRAAMNAKGPQSHRAVLKVG